MIQSPSADLRFAYVYCSGTHMTIAVYRADLPDMHDRFAGTPVYDPSGFPTARVTVGFPLTSQF